MKNVRITISGEVTQKIWPRLQKQLSGAVRAVPGAKVRVLGIRQKPFNLELGGGNIGTAKGLTRAKAASGSTRRTTARKAA